MTDSPEQSIPDAIAEIWHQALGARPTTSTDFFEAGGNSMLAAIVTTKVKRTVEKDVQMITIFEHRTFEAYVASVESLRNARVPS